MHPVFVLWISEKPLGTKFFTPASSPPFEWAVLELLASQKRKEHIVALLQKNKITKHKNKIKKIFTKKFV